MFAGIGTNSTLWLSNESPHTSDSFRFRRSVERQLFGLRTESRYYARSHAPIKGPEKTREFRYLGFLRLIHRQKIDR